MKFNHVDFCCGQCCVLLHLYAQTAGDIASVIKEAILSDKPHLHYQTSVSMKAVAAMKFKDPTGDSVVQMIAGRNTQK